jgi:hypothetical protein
MGPIGCFETSVDDNQYTMRNIEEEFFLGHLTFEDGTDKLYRNVRKYQSTLRNLPEEFFLDHLTFEMGPIGCPETSVTNYQSTLRNIPEERRSQWSVLLLPL